MNTQTNRYRWLLVLTTVLFASTSAVAVEEHNVGPGLTYVGAPLALRGVDPVAFIEVGNRIPGHASFAAEHEGVAYYFATARNRDTFAKNPDRFIPQNGGFCTYGVSLGKKFDGDPSYAAVVDKKLYLFLNEGVYREFLKDQAGTISKADSFWGKIKHRAATEL